MWARKHYIERYAHSMKFGPYRQETLHSTGKILTREIVCRTCLFYFYYLFIYLFAYLFMYLFIYTEVTLVK